MPESLKLPLRSSVFCARLYVLEQITQRSTSAAHLTDFASETQKSFLALLRPRLLAIGLMRKRARAEEALYARENASESDNASDEDGEDSNAAAYAQQTTVEARTHGTGDHSAAEANVHVPSSSFAPNEKPLVLCSRGIPARYAFDLL